MNRRLRSVGTILLGLAAVASSVQFPISAKATVSVDCKNFDAYKVGASVRHSCGVRDYPLDHIASLPGGGKEYVYFIDGHKTTYRIPPAGFSFVTATSDQLAEYNLPARPANPTEGARWFESMSKLHLVAPPPFLVTLPRSASSYSQIWSGYVTTGGGYWLAKGYWNEISQGSSCSGSTALTWAGIGGWGSSGHLAQAGTEVGVGGAAPHTAWWEVLPDIQGIQAISGVVAHPGYGFFSQVTWVSSGGYYNFFVQDSYNGAGSNFNYSTSSYDGESGDYIIERASPPVTALANFYYVNFLNDYANGSGSGNTINHYPYTDIRMTSNGGSGGTDLAHVTQSVNSNGGFQVHYYNCQ